MTDSTDNTLQVGDRVVIGPCSPKYVSDALCVVTGVFGNKLDLTIESMKSGSSPHRRFRNGSKIHRIQRRLVSKI